MFLRVGSGELDWPIMQSLGRFPLKALMSLRESSETAPPPLMAGRNMTVKKRLRQQQKRRNVFYCLEAHFWLKNMHLTQHIGAA